MKFILSFFVLGTLLTLTLLHTGCGRDGTTGGARAPFGGLGVPTPVPYPTYADPGFYIPRPIATPTPVPTHTPTPNCDDDSSHGGGHR